MSKLHALTDVQAEEIVKLEKKVAILGYALEHIEDMNVSEYCRDIAEDAL